MKTIKHCILALITSSVLGCASVPSSDISPALERNTSNADEAQDPDLIGLLDLGQRQYYAERYSAAQKTYLAIANKYPTNAESRFRLGNIAMIQEQFNTAIRYYSEAKAINKQHPKANFNLAMAHLALAEKELEEYEITSIGVRVQEERAKALVLLKMLNNIPK